MRLKIAWQDLSRKPIQNILAVIIGGVAIALAIAVLLISASVQQGMVDAAMPFDMIVGAKGSPTQLILNTIFLTDTPIGNIPASVREDLATDDRVERVIPFAFGDNYQGYRVVGTSPDLFEIRVSPSKPPVFQLAEGDFFTEAEGHIHQDDHDHQDHLEEASADHHDESSAPAEHQHDDASFPVVLGAEVAHKTGLKLGDSFFTTHGLAHQSAESDQHQHAMEVVGILRPMNLPYDKGIFTSLEALWEAHGTRDGEVTALMVTPVNYGELMEIYQEINQDSRAQAALPGAVMGDLFNILGMSTDILRAISWIVLAMALIALAISLNWSAVNRTRDNAILRVLGAGRNDILTIVVLQGLVIAVGASLLGLALGHLCAWGVARYIKTTTAIYSPAAFVAEEIWLILVAIGLSLVLSLIPAIRSYRADVVEDLALK